MAQLTIEEIKPGNFTNVVPEFGRVDDIRRLFGVKKGILYRWIKEKRIRSFCQRDIGKQKGIRLIDVASVRQYIQSQMQDAISLSE